MKKVKNISGVAVSVPHVAAGDVQPGQVIDVPDDTLMPAEYFEDVKPAKALTASKE